MAFTLDSDQKTIRDRVDFAIVALPVFDAQLGTSVRDPALDARLEELTTYFTVFSFIAPRTDILRAPSIDAALRAGTKDFCLIQNAGHLFYGQRDLALDLKAALEACEFLTGAIHDRGGYFHLDDQCALVNRRAWERLGRPAFGSPHGDTETVAVPAYTPSPTGTVEALSPSAQGPLPIRARFGYGWNAISASLAAGLAVRGWPAELARWHQSCAAYREDIGTWREALLDNVVAPRPSAPPGLRQYLDVLCKRFTLNADHPPVFVFNSEADIDIPMMGLRAGIDTAFLLAAGFKSNRILETLGFHETTEVVTYDYSAAALALKQLTIEEWDGVDFGRFFLGIRPRLEAMFTRKLYYLQSEALANVDAINREFQAEMRTVFTGLDHWVAHWQRFRRLRHHYVKIDLIDQPQDATRMIAAHARGDSVMWVSDMFNAPYAVGKFAWPRRQAAFAALVETMAAATESYLLLGGAPAYWRSGST